VFRVPEQMLELLRFVMNEELYLDRNIERTSYENGYFREVNLGHV